MELKDERVKIANEVLSGIKVFFYILFKQEVNYIRFSMEFQQPDGIKLVRLSCIAL